MQGNRTRRCKSRRPGTDPRSSTTLGSLQTEYRWKKWPSPRTIFLSWQFAGKSLSRNSLPQSYYFPSARASAPFTQVSAFSDAHSFSYRMFLFKNLFVLHIQVPGNIKWLSLKKEKKKKSSTGKAKSLPRTASTLHFAQNEPVTAGGFGAELSQARDPSPVGLQGRPNPLPESAPAAGAHVLALVPRMRPVETLAPKTAGAHLPRSGEPPSRLLAGLQGPVYSWAGGNPGNPALPTSLNFHFRLRLLSLGEDEESEVGKQP